MLRFCIGIDRAETQTTQAERDCLALHARGKLRAMEIGVFEAVTTIVIANNLPRNAEFFGVDPFFKGRFGVCWGKYIAKLNLWRSGVASRVKIFEGLSWDAAKCIDGDFDFLFIDGDHSLDSIRKDYSLFSDRIQVNGILALHDTSVPDRDPSVASLGSFIYFRDHISKDERFEIAETVDSLNVLRRVS
ncbi:class I SAM-dependent methyltransferase [Silicimonas algicola]|nr:class I SAM-dependent methyltransferase [Silicimonas algicola]